MASRQDCGDRDSVLLRRPDVGALRGVAMNRAMLLLALLSPLLGCWGCAAWQGIKDAHAFICDTLGDEQRAAIEAESVSAGITPDQALAIFKATCLLSMQRGSADVAGNAIGAIAKSGSKPCAE
jgi:hypothetical protein